MNPLLFTLLMLTPLLSFFGSKEPENPEDALVRAREKMVETQLEGRDITDRNVLDAFRKVERHKFVPDIWRDHAYDDTPLPIGEGQTISQPYIVALMTQMLHLNKDHKVLEIGTGSGYQAAILGELVDSVFTIEIVDTLAKEASARLQQLGYTNVHVRSGDGYRGWPEYAPFDAIIVTAAPNDIPKPLQEQLAEGGRMVIPVGDTIQELVLLTKKEGKLERKSITAVRFVPMTGEAEGQ